MNETRLPSKTIIGHLMLSGVMLGCAFPPLELGPLAFAACIPLLFVFERESGYGRILKGSYLWLFVVHCITVYWTGGFTHGKDTYLMLAGAALLIFHPLFYAPAILAITFIKRNLGWNSTLAAIPFVWTAWEYLLSKGELSFPWLSFGHTQTYDLAAIQFADITGMFGISLWILAINVLLFLLIGHFTRRSQKLKSSQTVAVAIAVILLLIAPRVYGHLVMPQSASAEPETQPTLAIAAVQPNIDPFEKWSLHGPAQLSVLLEMTDRAIDPSPDLVIWPETAVPFYLFAPQNADYLNLLRRRVDSMGIPLLSGIPDLVYYADSVNAPASSKVAKDGRRYENYNSSMLMIPGEERVQRYAKSILVPFAERVPFSDELSFLNAMKWNLGLGGWGMGKDSTIFAFRLPGRDSARFSSFICYESIYPGYVAGYVRRGAQFLIVVTNDSWWGNTSGAYQHKQFAVFRAIENRRWLVRCANGGISCVIDPAGRSIHETGMYTQAIVRSSVELRREITFYSHHGDWLPAFCLIVALGALSASVGAGFYRRVRRLQSSPEITGTQQ